MSSAPERSLRPRDVPPEVLGLLARLGQEGHRSWLVGGVVRDLLLRRARHDPGEFDVATPARPEEVTRIFPRVVPTGIDHGTVTVLAGGFRVEVTTFRGEGDYVDGRRPSVVTFHGDLEADLARRDFTVNAMAWDPLAGELRDPFGGRRDLARRLVRAVGEARERFAEDGLRPLRAARFVAQLGFRLAPATREAIPGALPVVARVSRERVGEEVSRLVTGPHAAAGLRTLAETGLLGVVLPRLSAMPADRVRHAVSVAAEAFGPCRPRRGREVDREACRLLRLAGLLHVLPPEEVRESVVALRLPNRVADGVVALCGARRAVDVGGPLAPGSGRAGVRRWLSSVGAERAPLLLELWAADARHQGARTRGRSAEVRALRARITAELRRRPPLALADLALGGKDVMAALEVAGGREVGEALRHLLDLVLEDPARNETETLSRELRAWRSGRVETDPGPASR